MRSLLLNATLLACVALAGCASGKFKERQAQRDRVASTSGMFCEFVSGDEFPDVDVETNLRMAQRCDSNKPFSITNYKNASENFGLVYCCSMVNRSGAKPVVANSSSAANSAAAVSAGPASSKSKDAKDSKDSKDNKDAKADDDELQ